MSEPSHQITVRVTTPIYERLCSLAASAERTVAAEVRFALKEYVASPVDDYPEVRSA